MNEWVPLKERIEVVPSNSVSTGSWYGSGTKDLVAKLPKIEIPRVDGLSTEPPGIRVLQNFLLQNRENLISKSIYNIYIYILNICEFMVSIPNSETIKFSTFFVTNEKDSTNRLQY